MRIVALLLLALLPSAQEPSEIATWIADLGHEDIARRDAAQANLLKAGEKALPDLKKSELGTEEAYRLARLRSIIGAIERVKFEKDHDAAQRPLQLQLVTVRYDRLALSDVLTDLTKQRGTRFVQQIIPPERVTLSLQDVSVRQVYDAIERQLNVQFVEHEFGTDVKLRQMRVLPRAYAPGVVLEFSRRPYNSEGIGLKATSFSPGRIQVTEWIVAGENGKPLPLERCEACGPMLVLAKGAEGKLRVRVKGVMTWDSVYPLDIAEPAQPKSFQVGKFNVDYAFPNVKIASAEETPLRLFPSVTAEVRSKSGPIQPPRMTTARCGTLPKPSSWCDCPNSKARSFSGVNRSSSVDLRFMLGGHKDLSDVESIRIRLHKPIEEPFEVELVLPGE